MYVSRLALKNWRNFTAADVELARRVFVVGNNGLGKSNLLDAFRFLRDIAKERGGGLQEAIEQRGGMERVRSLFAGKNTAVQIQITAREDAGKEEAVSWEYQLSLKQGKNGKTPRRALIEREVVKKNGAVVLARPTAADKADPESLTQTALEQIHSNKEFRPLANFLQGIEYLHLVPQLVRNASALQARALPDDPYGQALLDEMAKLPEKSRQARLNTITDAIHAIKPQFSDFEFKRDAFTGQPHLEYGHKNWRAHAARQNEQQLSDGELRLIGLLWALLDNNQLLLLEEPEISFNESIVRALACLFAGAVARRKKRQMSQVILSTHSAALLDDEGISPAEIICLEADDNGATRAEVAKDDESIRIAYQSGLTAADTVLPRAQSPLKYFSLEN